MWGALTKKSNTSFDAHSFMQIRISSSSQRHFSLSSPCSETSAENPIKMDGADWRSQLRDDSRQRIVNKIMETLKRHVPISGPEGLIELRKIAVRFEEKIYSAATSQTDYLRKISLKMVTMETKSQNLTPNAAGGNQSQPYQDESSMIQTKRR